jgi:preprotein translocase subunit SecA
VAQAGRPGAITIATNMAGRGTDIVLGGNLESEYAQLGEIDEVTKQSVKAEWQKRHDAVLAAGGLHIIGTERHESRRIDNQLRGRSGRQGDAGSSRFYLSLEDNLMRIFGDPERTKRWLQTAGMKEGEVIESRMLSKQIERAQRKVEAHNFDARKNLLEYDDVSNDQRKVIYSQRTELMAAEDVSDAIAGIRREVVNLVVDRFVPPKSVEDMWDVPALTDAIERDFAVRLEIKQWLEADANLNEELLHKRIAEEVDKAYEQKVQSVGVPVMRHLEKAIMLQQLDMHWREHLAAMDYLRQGIHLRSYAQKNPKQEYKREAFELFTNMLERVKQDTISLLARLQVRSQAEIDAEEEERQRRLASAMQFQHAAPPEALALGAVQGEEPEVLPSEDAQTAAVQQFIREGKKVGRNEPCPCGSGKKFKHCHGALATEE